MRQWIVELPAMPPLSLNDRMHYMQRARMVKEWRNAAAWCVKAERIPRLVHATVGLRVNPPDRRKRDASNLVATHKAVVDGLVDAGVVPDDDPKWVTELMPSLGEPVGEWRLQLLVRGVVKGSAA